MAKKLITVGIPAYHAEDQIIDAISSIQIQSADYIFWFYG